MKNDSFYLKTLKEVAAHKDLLPHEIKELNEATARVYWLMLDKQWHAATAIIRASGQREGLRRMRTLRRMFRIEKRRLKGREFEYRLQSLPKNEQQTDLFSGESTS